MQWTHILCRIEVEAVHRVVPLRMVNIEEIDGRERDGGAAFLSQVNEYRIVAFLLDAIAIQQCARGVEHSHISFKDGVLRQPKLQSLLPMLQAYLCQLRGSPALVLARRHLPQKPCIETVLNGVYFHGITGSSP